MLQSVSNAEDESIWKMNDAARKYLTEIKSALSLIEEFCVDVHQHSRYVADAKTRSAVERQLEIICAAIRQLSQQDASVRFTAANKMLILGKQIQSCAPLDDTLVWSVLRNDLPQLKSEVTSFLTA